MKTKLMVIISLAFSNLYINTQSSCGKLLMNRTSLFKKVESLLLNFFIVMLYFLSSTMVNAQNFKKHTENFGFVWSETYIDHGLEILDGNGNIIIPHSRGYNGINYDNRKFVVYKGYKNQGACKLSGEEIISPDSGYNSVVFHDDWIEVSRDGKHGVCDIAGKEVVSPRRGYDDVFVYALNIYVKTNGKQGVCDLTGKEIISPDKGYDKVNVYRGWIQVERSGKQGAYDLTGKEIISPDKGYDEVFILSDSWIQVKKNGKQGVCDITGKEIISLDKGYDNVGVNVDKEYVWVKRDGKVGICDLSGKVIISLIYDDITNKDGIFKYKDVNGEWQPVPASSYASPTKVLSSANSKSKAKTTPATGNSAMSSTDRDAQVKREKIVENDGFIWYELSDWPNKGVEDANGNILIPLSKGYTNVRTNYRLGEWFFKVEKNGLISLYNRKGEELIPLDRGYNDVTVFSNHLLVKRNNKYGICDMSGEELISPDRGYDWVSVFTDYIKVEKNNKYGACDLAGNEVAAPLYNNINFAGDIYYYIDAYGKSQPIPTASNKSPIYASSSASSDSKSTSNSKPRSTYTPRFYTPYQPPIYKARSSSNRNVRNYNSNRSVTQTGNASYSETSSSSGSSYNSRTSRTTHSSSRSSSYESDNSRNKRTKITEQRRCYKCSGSGKVKCNTCRGDGRLKCGACKGTGYWTQKGVRHDCAACDRGFTRCNSCGGKGTRNCTSCSGKGYHITEKIK